MSDKKTEQLLDKFDSDVKTYDVSRAGKKTRKQKSIYGDQLLCLLALLVMSVWQSGYRALVLGIAVTLVCIFSDMLFCYMTKKTYNPKDLSTIATGLCLTLMMPASVHYGVAIGGGLLAISVKHIFGGKDNYIFNPTCVAIAFLIICYPSDMLLYPSVGVQPEVFANNAENLVVGIENYLLKLGTAPTVTFQDMILGNFVGPMGTTHFLIITVCGICLLCRRSLSILVTVFGLGSYCALTALFPVYSSIGDTLVLELIGGYLLFGFVFLASDPQTLPKTIAGRIAYGLLIGILGCLFRHFGKVEGSFIFVLLIANALSLHLDSALFSAGAALKSAFKHYSKNIGKFERLKEGASSDEPVKRISDTMEIIVPPTNYNMPPVDNKVTKIKRKKTNVITRYAEKLRLKKKKDEIIKKQQESDYLAKMRAMEKKRTSKDAKPKENKSDVPHRIKQPQQKSQQKNNKQGKK